MRTKITILAAAALAAGVLSSQAQVYSANIVGYVNTPFLGDQKFNMTGAPFNTGVSNGINEVFGTLPDGTVVYLFNGTGYVSYGYDATIGIDSRNWYSGDFTATLDNLPIVSPTNGMFVQLPAGSANTTNTYVGAVAVNTGFSGTNTLTSGVYNFVASFIPYGGDLSGTSVNFVPPDGTLVLQWNPTASSFVSYGYDSTIGVNPDNWYTGDFTAISPTPQAAPGGGFFAVPGGFGAAGTYKWVQSLP